MKGISVVLILAICVGNIFCHMPVSAAETNRMTMTELYNHGDCLSVEEGDTVTIESLEEWNMFVQYADIDTYYMQGVTVELLDDIQVTPYKFSYDEETMRIGISWYDSLEAAYDVNSKRYYKDIDSAQVINYRWPQKNFRAVQHFNGIFEGNGHYISGVYSDLAGGMIFKEIENGQIRNLNLSHFYSEGDISDALCGTFSGEMINCHGSDLFLFGSWAGGLVGSITGQCETSVTDCSAEAYMFPGGVHPGSFGGLIRAVGEGAKVMMEKNHTSGLIYGIDYSGVVGGMVGCTSEGGTLDIRNCVSEVNIAGEVGWAGGIVGWHVTSLFNCENRGDISAFRAEARAGGLLGIGGFNGFRGTTVIDQCRNTGKIRSSRMAGGIVGTARGIEIKNTENVGDVCFEDQDDDSVDSLYGGKGIIGGIVGRVEEVGSGTDRSSVAIKNSFCSGNVMGGKTYAGGFIGALGTGKSSLAIDNVCFYGKVDAEEEEDAGIILGGGGSFFLTRGEGWYRDPDLTAEIEEQNVYYHEQKISSAFGEGVEIQVCVYPVSEAQMSGAEKDHNIGQGDFAQTPSLCDALNSWCRAQDESAGIIGWKQGETFPVLEIDDAEKPEKPNPIIFPTKTPTPTADPVQSVGPIITPEESPVVTSTVAPTPKPTIASTKPTIKPSPTIVSTLNQTPEPTEQPVQTELPSTPPAEVFTPLETETPTPSQEIEPTLTPSPSPTAGTAAKAKKLKAPTFSVKKKRTDSGKQYVSIRLKKYKGTHAEIWVGKQKKKRKKFVYYKLKLKQNNIRKMKGIFNFQYAKQKGTLAFKIRTYAKQGKKRVYSHKSKAKRIRLS